LGSKLKPERLFPQPFFDVMARDMSLVLLLVVSALAAQDAASGPVHSNLRGAVGNSSGQALLRAGSAPCSASSRIGKNSYGTNLRQAGRSNVAADCCKQCHGEPACSAWTWIDGSNECWLKSWVPDEGQWASEGGVTSGLKGLAPPSKANLSDPGDVESTGVKCCKGGSDNVHCHSYTEDFTSDYVCEPSVNYPEAKCARHGIWPSNKCCTPDDLGTAWVFGGCH